MRNIFPASRRKDKTRTTGNQLFKRSIALGAALLLLWVALTVMPKASIATEPVIISDEAGTVATSISAATPSTTTTGLEWDLGKITAGLLLAGLLGFATYWQKKQAKQQIHLGHLNTLGKLQLGPGQLVHLVQCGEEAVLVGTSNNQITLLHHFSKQNLAKPNPVAQPVIPAPTYSSPSTTAANNDNFGVLLQQQNLLSTATLDIITKDALKPVPQS